jgi:short-subunit dehydrogenase
MAKRIVLTGASGGIGSATAIALAREGHALYLVGRDATVLRSLAQRCLSEGAAAARGIEHDVCEPWSDASWPPTEIAADGEWVAIHAAGQAAFGDLLAMKSDEIENQIAVNLMGAVWLCRAVLPRMLEEGSGLIVTTGSVASRRPFAQSEAYCASKAALRMFSQCLAESYRARGVRVTSVLPGATDTSLWRRQEWSPDPRDMLRPEAVAEAIRWIVQLPPDQVVEELALMPPKGVL